MKVQALAAGVMGLWGVGAALGQTETTVVSHTLIPERVEATEERVAGLWLPEGFRIEKFAERLGKPRFMAAGPDGAVYITRREPGDVLLVRDRDGDGRAEEVRTALKIPHSHGITVSGDRVYIASVNEVYSAEIGADGSLGTPTVVIDDLPDGGQHPNRTIALGADGAMYITIGSTCNACREPDPEHASILRWAPGTPGGKGEREVFATGLRNTLGFGWHPETGEMWGMDHGTDNLGDDRPEEELNRLVRGGEYGWPYFGGGGTVVPNVELPEGTTLREIGARMEQPVLTYTAHAAPLGMVFLNRAAFPAEYRGDALVAMHGSWNRSPASGYEVVRVRFDHGQPESIEPFLTGFLEEDGRSQFGRPVGLLVMADGSVLLSDDSNGVVYRIRHEGARAGGG